MISQNIPERTLNITSIIVNIFKSFIKKVYQKECRQNINLKMKKNDCFRTGISKKVEKVPTPREKKGIDLQ